MLALSLESAIPLEWRNYNYFAKALLLMGISWPLPVCLLLIFGLFVSDFKIQMP
jgi:hypothetical protein